MRIDSSNVDRPKLNTTRHHITVCICTYRRALLLEELLAGLLRQKTDDLFTYSIVVADNDVSESAKELVEGIASTSRVKISYCVEGRRNIALVRNKSLEYATGRHVAFIDDDEFPGEDWLLTLWNTCETLRVDGVLGPVLPRFEPGVPDWVLAGGFYSRPQHHTGFLMGWLQCRTGNVLLRREVINQLGIPFRKEFGTGGEDQDFFRRAIERGHQFVWCDEAPVYEWVPQSRCTSSFLLRRALLRGSNSLQHPRGRVRAITKSVIAVPGYCLVVLFLLLSHSQYLMKYSVKLMDHLGRLLALARINPITKRPM